MGEMIERPALFAGESTECEPTRLIDWPGLEELGLGGRERAERLAGIGGSDANIILSGDAERILGLWREKRGEVEPADLGDNLAVMLGC